MEMKKRFANIFTVFLAVVMVLAFLPVISANAAEAVKLQTAEIVESGTFQTSGSTGVSWTLDSDGVLTLSGKGVIPRELFPTDGASLFHRDWPARKDKIKSIIIEEGITAINYAAFSSCTTLESLSIPGSMKTIDKRAFYGCTNLSELKFADGSSDLTINEYAFTGCAGIKELSLPKNTKYIKQAAFSGTAIETVELPEGIEEAGWGFGTCTVHCHGTQCEFQKKSWFNAWYLPNMIFEDGYGHSFGEGMLVETDNEEADGRLQYTCENCGKGYYYDYKKDEKGVQIIKGFNELFGIHDIQFPSEIEGLPVVSIGSKAFAVGSTWYFDKDLYLPETLTELTEYAFEYCEFYGRVILPSDMTEIPARAFMNCTTSEIVLPEELKKIGDAAFAGSAISKLEFPVKNTINAGEYILNGCENLKTLYIPGNIKYTMIQGNTAKLSPFCGNNCLEEVTVEGSQDDPDREYYRLPIAFFQECSNLKIVRFTRPINNIRGAFINCGAITDIYYPGTEESWKQVFKDDSESSSEAYLSATVHCLDSHEHTLEKTEAAEAGCRTVGNIEYWTCSSCEQMFKDPNAKERIDSLSETVIPATGNHVPGLPVQENVCENGSYDDVTYCMICGEEIARNHIEGGTTPVDPDPPVWHEHTMEFVEEVPETCTQPGTREHYHCTICGQDFVDEAATYSVNPEDLVIEMAEHTWVTTPEYPATCTEDGQTAGVLCSVCGEILSTPSPIHATGIHTPAEPVQENLQPNGSYDEVIYCIVCGEQIDRQYINPVIPVNEIILDPFTAQMTVGETITINATIQPENATGQTLVWYDYDSPNVTIEPDGLRCKVTALVAGYVSIYLRVDDPGYATEGMCWIEIAPAPVNPICDHVLEYVENRPPSCTQPGTREHYHCTICGQDFADESAASIMNPEDLYLEMTGHIPVVDPAVKATYTKTGLTEGSHCSICGEVLTAQKVVPKLVRAANKITKVTTKKVLKYKTLKKKKQTFTISAKAKETKKLTYKLSSVTKKARKYITVSKAGKVTVKKGLKKGKYKLTVTITAPQTAKYKQTTVTKTITIQVK